MRIHEIIRLDELTGYKSQPEYQGAKSFGDALSRHDRNALKTDFWTTLAQNRGRFKDFLKARGFSILGSGAYGIVFTHPGLDYVIKVFHDDPHYRAFVDFCQTSEDNPHLPKFRGKMMRINDKTLAVRMEKLDGGAGRSMLYALGYYAALLEQDPHGARQEFFADLPNRFGVQMVAYFKANQGLLDTMDELNAVRGDASFDFSGGNVMQRDQGAGGQPTYVITDPFAE